LTPRQTGRPFGGPQSKLAPGGNLTSIVVTMHSELSRFRYVGYFTMLSVVSRLYNVERWDDRRRRIGKDLVGSGRGLMKILSHVGVTIDGVWIGDSIY
jgi:hypothetical protein